VAVLAFLVIGLVPLLFVHLDPNTSRRGLAPAISAATYVILLFIIVRSALRPLQAPTSASLADMILAGLGLVLPFVLAGAAPGGNVALRRFGFCFFIGMAAGWALLTLLRALDRGAHQSRSAAWLAVAGAGLATNFALHFDCPETGALHRLFCHATVGLALALQYMLAIRLARPRSKRTLA
jgi:hypothetical protein